MSKVIKGDRDVTLSDVGRSILNSIVLISTSLLLLAISCLAFFFFYHHNVPAIGVQKQVHLQHHLQDNPYALVDLEFSTAKLTTSQPYNIIVELVVPDTPANHDLGNFMIGLAMLGTDEEPIVQSARSSILRYSSPIIDTASTVLQSGPILLGFKHEAQTLRVLLLEDYQFESGWLVNPSQARIEVFAPSLRVYSCRILFETKMKGLPWVLYTFKLTSFIVFTTLFWLSSMAFMLLTWLAVTFTILPQPAAASRAAEAQGRGMKKSAEGGALGIRLDSSATLRDPSVASRSRGDIARSTRSVAPSSVETSFFDFDSRDRREDSIDTDATTVDDPFVKIDEEED